jgi:hypothetical protein
MKTIIPRQVFIPPCNALIALTLAAAFIAMTPATANAHSSCRHSGQAVGDFLAVQLGCSRSPETHGAETMKASSDTSAIDDRSSTQPHQLPYFAYSLVIGGQTFCAGGRALVACSPGTAPPVPPATVAQPQVTPGAVLTAIRRVGLPALTARTQPEGKTLVNFATIFYTQPRPFSRTVSLLGRQVQVVATPASYTWHYGDGTSTTTKRPGAPYPAKDVTHNYTDAHTTVQTSVDVTYSGRFRVGNGDWLSIPGSVTIAGPSTPLRVSEATAVLSGNYE